MRHYATTHCLTDDEQLMFVRLFMRHWTEVFPGWSIRWLFPIAQQILMLGRASLYRDRAGNAIAFAGMLKGKPSAPGVDDRIAFIHVLYILPAYRGTLVLRTVLNDLKASITEEIPATQWVQFGLDPGMLKAKSLAEKVADAEGEFLFAGQSRCLYSIPWERCLAYRAHAGDAAGQGVQPR